MRLFADTCEQLNYVLVVHDNYRDYYLDTKSYNERHATIRADGTRDSVNNCSGGIRTCLCPRLALGHVKKNYRTILAQGVKIRGAYLDVFSCVPADECYNPEHLVTRADCLKCWGDCLDFIRTRVGVVSSEEGADWAIPHIDMAYWVPYAYHGGGQGIPVPLHSLVYHDAILVPWTLGKGTGVGWHGIPKDDSGYLHALANAGLPYLSLTYSDFATIPGEAPMTQVRTVCARHERVGLLEMTNHEFLDESYREQRTTFADGTTVTIDLDAGTFEILPKLPAP